MASVSTEDFPYTLEYVRQLLNMDETELLRFGRSLGITPREDQQTGELIFSHRETEILRKAIEMNRRGEDMNTIARYFGLRKGETATAPGKQKLPAAGGGQMTTGNRQGGAVSKKENLAVIVEAVSSAKEGILKDMSRLLDDKLTGLDEVVVELIRCKSENDALKQQVESLADEKAALQQELNSYKPAGFGFFRKG